jgi:hypothetical protein
MNELTKAEFFDVIQNEIKGTTFVTASIETEVKMLKRGNPYAGESVTKVQNMNGAIGFDYENSVNRQRDREGNEENFEANSRKWGILLEGRKIVEHKGNYYLQFKVENSSNVKYFMNGQEIEKEMIAEWLPKKKESTTQDVEKQVIVRDVKFDSIKSIKMKGMEYLLI